MSEWSDAVQFATRRASRLDKGAVAAREGILGLPLTQSGTTAERCYEAASKARNAVQTSRQRRNKALLPDGSTGNGDWDRKLGASPRRKALQAA